MNKLINLWTFTHRESADCHQHHRGFFCHTSGDHSNSSLTPSEGQQTQISVPAVVLTHVHSIPGITDRMSVIPACETFLVSAIDVIWPLIKLIND